MKQIRFSSLSFLIILFALFLTGFLFYDTVKAEESKKILTLQDIINIAVKNHPLLRQSLAQIRQTKGSEIETESNSKPQVSFQSSYNQNGSFNGGTVLRTNSSGQVSSFSGSSGGLSSSLSLQQLITDFGRTNASIRAAKENVIQSQQQLYNVIQQVLLNAYQGYYSVLQNEALVKVQEESVANLKKHLNQAESFFEVGTKPKIDVTQARVNLSNGLLSLEQAGNALEVAKTHLNTVMGTNNLLPYEVKGELNFEEFSITLEAARAKAF
ncbi:MAG: TolC family protein, partial [Firmicutes bacterium]|nr:TolC family protein [Bacillota bacterium]